MFKDKGNEDRNDQTGDKGPMNYPRYAAAVRHGKVGRWVCRWCRSVMVQTPQLHHYYCMRCDMADDS